MPVLGVVVPRIGVESLLELAIFVLFGDPIAVGTARDVEDPVLMVEVPLHGFADTGGEGFCGFPTELSGNFRCVDGVAFVVTGAVFNEGDLGPVRGCVGFGAKCIEEVADVMNNVDVSHLIVAADVIDFPELSGFQNAADG